MARINVKDLASKAGPVMAKAVLVQQDVAVRKSWMAAGADVISAGSSVAQAVRETSNAWRRLSPTATAAGAV